MWVEAPAESARVSRFHRLAIITALAIYFCPFLVFSRLPTQDGPLHVDTASAMRESVGPHSKFFSDFIETRFAVETNTFGQDILIVCLELLNSAVGAEKLFQLIYLILFAGGATYFLNGVRVGAWTYTPLFLPLGYSYIFHMGFYNNCLSICGFLWCWGALLRYDAQPSIPKLLLLGCFSFLTWLSHPIGIVAFAAGAVCWASIQLFLARETSFMTRAKQIILPELVICAPLVSAAFFLRGRGELGTWTFESFPALSARLVQISMMDSFGLEGFFVAALIVSFICLALFILSSVRAMRIWSRDKIPMPLETLLLTIFYLVVFYLAPWDAAGSGYINERLMPCVYFFLIAQIASTKILPTVLSGSGIGILILLHYAHWPVYLQAELVERDYLFAVQDLKPEAIVYPLNTVSHGWNGSSYASNRTDFTAHLAGFYTAQCSGIYLNNTIARWREGRQIGFLNHIAQTLDALPAALPGSPTQVDFEPFAKAAGRPVDYVLLYGNFSNPRTLAVHYEKMLEDGFDCGLVSPRGLVKVCRKR
jgi:hypothetical protein